MMKIENREHVTLEMMRKDFVVTMRAIRQDASLMDRVNRNWGIALLMHKASSEFQTGNVERAVEHLENLIKGL